MDIKYQRMCLCVDMLSGLSEVDIVRRGIKSLGLRWMMCLGTGCTLWHGSMSVGGRLRCDAKPAGLWLLRQPFCWRLQLKVCWQERTIRSRSLINASQNGNSVAAQLSVEVWIECVCCGTERWDFCCVGGDVPNYQDGKSRRGMEREWFEWSLCFLNVGARDFQKILAWRFDVPLGERGWPCNNWAAQVRKVVPDFEFEKAAGCLRMLWL